MRACVFYRGVKLESGIGFLNFVGSALDFSFVCVVRLISLCMYIIFCVPWFLWFVG